jgi:cobalt/nickel transport protein
MENSGFEKDAKIKALNTAFETLGIRANDRCGFAIGLPKAGWWGISAVGAGPDKRNTKIKKCLRKPYYGFK